ncbi:MAG: pyrroline-5-carboxylate reductase [Planctomycetota bacterium]
MSGQKIGFFGGGQMATALAGGAIAGGVCTEEDLVFVEPSEAQQEKLKSSYAAAKILATPQEMMAESDKVFLAVKPHILRQELDALRTLVRGEQLLISIATGISLADLQNGLGSNRVIRVMPNTPCLVGEGASAMSVAEDIAEEDASWVRNLLSSVGEVVTVPDHLIHAITGVSGSSPAYIYMVIEALSDGGVSQGLPRDVATKMAAQAVLGAAKMVLESGLHPGELKDQVTSPGGTTIAAIRELEAAGVRSAFIEAVAASSERSEELS